MSPLTGGPWRSPTQGGRKQTAGPEAGEGGGQSVINADSFILQGEKVLEIDGNDGCMTM